jgi:beta-barrel assembly-enhancing protease
MKRQLIPASVAIALLSLVAGAWSQAALISEKQELQMGKDGAKQIEAQYPVSNDAAMNTLVQSIGAKIAASSTRPGLQWQFKVLDVSDVNAVSVPAYVYVNRGLIQFVGGDKDALAGVIGHEIGHTCGKHAVKSAEQQLKYSLLLGLLKSNNTQQLGGLAANLALLGYSRKDEYQADKYGVDFMTKAGYDPNGMLRFFSKLQAKEGSGSSGLATYFQTHPPTGSRITRVQKEMKRIGVPIR